MPMQPFECESCGREMMDEKELCHVCEDYQHGEDDNYIDHDIYEDQFEREYEEPNPYHGTYSEE